MKILRFHVIGTWLLLLCSALLVPRGWAQGVVELNLKDNIGWIPMQEVTADHSAYLDLHRFYFAAPLTSHRLELSQSVIGDLQVESRFDQFQLVMTANSKAKGIFEIPLKIYEQRASPRRPLGQKDMQGRASILAKAERVVLESVLLVAITPADGHVFSYPGTDPNVEKVYVVGDFNDWNPTSHRLKRGYDGDFGIFVPLAAGSYPYKLIIDGKRTLDPANPEKVPGNKGGPHSVARVVVADRGVPPVVFAEEIFSDRLLFRIVPGDSNIVQVSSVLQMPGGNSKVIAHWHEGDRVSVEVSSVIEEGAWVRVVVADDQGNVSNAARAPVKVSTSFQWQDGIIYYAFTDRFANGNQENDRPVDHPRLLPLANYQGGDFQGISQKIKEDYFQDLGINIIRLPPLHPNPEGAWQETLEPYRYSTGYHGRWPVSSFGVDSRLGGEEALHQMIGAAHQDEIFVMADSVVRQVHTDHPLYGERPDLFHSLRLPDASRNLQRWREYPSTTYNEQWLPVLDFTNPEAIALIVDRLLQFSRKFKLDGYGFSQVQYTEKSFWWKYRAAQDGLSDSSRAVPFYSRGEALMNRFGVASFVGPSMLNGQFDFPLYQTIIEVLALEKSGMEALEKSLSRSEFRYGKETPMSPALGHHQRSRFMAYADGDLPKGEKSDGVLFGWDDPPKVDDPAAYEKLKLGFTFILSIDGVPMLYYGDEIGMSGAGMPDNQRMMRWGNQVTAEEESVREHFRKVAAVRHRHPALRYGSRRPLVAEGNRLAFVRAHLGDRVLAVWNRGKSQTEFSLEVAPEMTDGPYIDALSGQEIEVKEGKVSFKMSPTRSALFVAKES